MGTSSDPDWTPWGAVMAAIKVIEDLLKIVTQNERDPFIRGGFTLLAIGFGPIVVVVFVLVSFFLAILRIKNK